MIDLQKQVKSINKTLNKFGQQKYKDNTKNKDILIKLL